MDPRVSGVLSTKGALWGPGHEIYIFKINKIAEPTHVAVGLIGTRLLFVCTPHALVSAVGGVTGAAASATYYLPRLVLAAGLRRCAIRRVAERRG